MLRTETVLVLLTLAIVMGCAARAVRTPGDGLPKQANEPRGTNISVRIIGPRQVDEATAVLFEIYPDGKRFFNTLGEPISRTDVIDFIHNTRNWDANNALHLIFSAGDQMTLDEVAKNVHVVVEAVQSAQIKPQTILLDVLVHAVDQDLTP